jgi:hypothetical protein
VFERWCHVGTARSEQELADLAEVRAQIDFDPDIYKIVQGFVAKKPRAVVPLPAQSSDCWPEVESHAESAS